MAKRQTLGERYEEERKKKIKEFPKKFVAAVTPKIPAKATVPIGTSIFRGTPPVEAEPSRSIARTAAAADFSFGFEPEASVAPPTPAPEVKVLPEMDVTKGVDITSEPYHKRATGTTAPEIIKKERKKAIESLRDVDITSEPYHKRPVSVDIGGGIMKIMRQGLPPLYTNVLDEKGNYIGDLYEGKPKLSYEDALAGKGILPQGADIIPSAMARASGALPERSRLPKMDFSSWRGVLKSISALAPYAAQEGMRRRQQANEQAALNMRFTQSRINEIADRVANRSFDNLYKLAQIQNLAKEQQMAGREEIGEAIEFAKEVHGFGQIGSKVDMQALGETVQNYLKMRRGDFSTSSREMAELPPPEKHKGKIVVDTTTNKRLKSDGKKWVEVK